MEQNGLQGTPPRQQEDMLRGPVGLFSTDELRGDRYVMEFSGGERKDYILQLKNEIYDKVLGILPIFRGHEAVGDKQIAEFIAHEAKVHLEDMAKGNFADLSTLPTHKLLPHLTAQIKKHAWYISHQGSQMFLILGAVALVMDKWLHLHGRSTYSDYQPDRSPAENEDLIYGASSSSPEQVEETVSEDKQLFYMMDKRDSEVFLRTEINEGSNVTGYISKIVHEHDKKTLWRLLQEAKKEHEISPGDNTLGGKFFKKIKQYKKKEDVLQQTQGLSSGIPEMREYQKRAVDIAVGSWHPWTKYRNENYLFVAPTGSGKTRIFIECSRYALEHYPGSKIVVIVPSVPLSKQHEASFLHHRFGDRDWRVESFSSENQINRDNWSSVLQTHSVLVMTAQSLLNQLDSKVATLNQIHLLILDEVHHTRSRSPYQRIMDHYKKLICGQPKVLGFSASPASGLSKGETYNKLKILQETLNSEIVYIGDDNEEIEMYVPAPNERRVLIKPCEHDARVQSGIRLFLTSAQQYLQDFLMKEAPGAEVRWKASNQIMNFVHQENALGSVQKFIDSSDHLKALSHIARFNLMASVELISECFASLNFLEEVGHEKALLRCAVQCVDIVLKQRAPLQDGLLRALLLKLCSIDPISSGNFISTVFTSDTLAHGMSFPKFVELRKFLEEEYLVQKQDFHGIVFTETRSAVHHLAAMLREYPHLESITFIEFTGHGKTKSSKDKIKGMTGKEQDRRLQDFRNVGRKVLVATAAAEEGLDIADCEFVVRYTAPKTGIQRVQSKGRSRKMGSVYLTLVLEKTLDVHLDEKSRIEEENLKYILKRMNAKIL